MDGCIVGSDVEGICVGDDEMGESEGLEDGWDVVGLLVGLCVGAELG